MIASLTDNARLSPPRRTHTSPAEKRVLSAAQSALRAVGGLEEFDRREREDRLRFELEGALERERERADRESERVDMERDKVTVMAAELTRVKDELALCRALMEEDAMVRVCMCVCVCRWICMHG